MNFRLYGLATGSAVDTVEMRVLAKACRAAGWSIHARDLAYCHRLEGADLLIDHGETKLTAAARAVGTRASDRNRHGQRGGR